MTSQPLTEALRETLALFDDAGAPRTTSEVAERLDLGRRSTYERLERLVDHGRLRTKKVGSSGRVWWRPPAAAGPTAPAPHWPAAAESLVDDVLDGVEAAIFVLDENFDVVWINAATERYFGLDRERAVGSDKRELIDEQIRSVVDEPEAFAETVRATYEDNSDTEQFECRVTRDDGREARWLEHRSRPIESGAYAGGRVELYSDVTAVKRSQQQLERRREEVESELEEVFDRISDGFVGLDEQLRFTYVNDRAESLLGIEESSVIGWDIRDAVHLTDQFESALQESLEDREPIFLEDYYGPLDAWFESAIYPSETGVSVYFRDITDRKERERDLARYETLFEESKDVNVIVEPDGTFRYLTPSAKNVFGYEPEELVGEVGFEYLHPDDREAAMAEFAKMIETPGYEPEIEFRFEHADGSWVVVDALARDLRDDPDIEGIVVYNRDVTERKRREQELERYVGLVDAVDEPVYELDARGRFTFVNEAFLETSGYSEDELLGEHVSIGMDEDAIARAESEIADLLADDGDEHATLEYEVVTKDGERIPVENRLSLLSDDEGRVYGSAGVLWDVTEREERERRLADREQALRSAYEVITDAERSFDDRVDGLLELVQETVATEYATLSAVEGDEYVFEAVRAPEDADLQAGDRVPLLATICEHVIGTREPLVLDDLEREAPELAGRADDADWGIGSYLGAPVVVDGEVYGTFCFYGDEPRAEPFTDWEVTFVELLSNWVSYELERQQRTDQLAALNDLNEVVNEITDSVIEQSTREEIERTVCERIAASDSYTFAWIADADPATGEIRPRVQRGVDDYLGRVDRSADPDDPAGQGPAATTFRTGEIAVSQNVFEDPAFEPWRGEAEAFGFRSFASIPIVHEGTLYGVIGVYSERAGAFAAAEQHVIGQLGEIVGHAIAAAERKRALMSDEVDELQFQIRDVFGAVGVDVPTAGTITLDHIVPIEDAEFLVYGTAAGEAVDNIECIVETVPRWVDLTLRDDGEVTSFELRLSEPPLLSTVAALGGSVEDAVIEDGDYRMTIHLAPGADVRQLIETVEAAYPDAELLKRRQITRPDRTAERVRHVLTTELTDRQRAVLEAAYHAGFFEWPRDASGADVAASLDIAPATFAQHLRKGQQKVFESLLSAPSTA